MKTAKMLQKPLEPICFVAERNLWCLPVRSEIPKIKRSGILDNGEVSIQVQYSVRSFIRILILREDCK